MTDSKNLWRLRARALEAARREVRAGHPEGIHDLRVALRRTSATAVALGEKRIAREAKDFVRGLSEARQLEVDRKLLRRVATLGLLAPELAAGLDGRWEDVSRKHSRVAARVAGSRQLQALARVVRERGDSSPEPPLDELERARRTAEARLTPPSPDATDRELHRFRLAVKRARYAAEDLVATGVRGFDKKVSREKALQEALGRWNDVRLFRERLMEMRREAEVRGSVTLASELDRLVISLDGTVLSARRAALRAAMTASRVVPIAGRTA